MDSSTPTAPARDLPGLAAAANAVLDRAEGIFIAHLGAQATVTKGAGDFATAADLALETFLRQELTAATGLEVTGEEFGGTEACYHSQPVWVVDPIDGTANYSMRSPLCAILVALVADGQPLISLTRVPLMNQRLTATLGGGLSVNGGAPQTLRPTTLTHAHIGSGSISPLHFGPFPGRYRTAVLEQVAQRAGRMRMLGSIGLDLAFVAQGIFSGALVFGRNIWDNAPGVLAVREAGGVVTDLAGAPWSAASNSVLAAAPQVHAELLEAVREVGDPGQFRRPQH